MPPGAAQGDDDRRARFVQSERDAQDSRRAARPSGRCSRAAGRRSELVPGLTECQVLDTAPDGSWQLIRQVIDYSWYVPKLTYVLRATL